MKTGFFQNRTSVDLKDKVRNLKKGDNLDRIIRKLNLTPRDSA